MKTSFTMLTLVSFLMAGNAIAAPFPAPEAGLLHVVDRSKKLEPFQTLKERSNHHAEAEAGPVERSTKKLEPFAFLKRSDADGAVPFVERSTKKLEPFAFLKRAKKLEPFATL
ncbi:hypothetical protein B0H66DRAFT_591530 [Apodospora peruviana]|uniref:Uncharacterized protein n=1 Tax=Apodospora peruviana TaxID=516989 RepID=A0AAE0I681_9PEZI|nr:hypothetical protein B0H66DRAFT_591530 [Apodospora peruviana]